MYSGYMLLRLLHCIYFEMYILGKNRCTENLIELFDETKQVLFRVRWQRRWSGDIIAVITSDNFFIPFLSHYSSYFFDIEGSFWLLRLR